MSGAELNAEIFRTVFGAEIRCSQGINCSDIPRYSEGMDDAMVVVQEMRKRGFDFIFSASARDLWYCSFAPPPWNPSSIYRGEMAAETICRAALLALKDHPWALRS